MSHPTARVAGPIDSPVGTDARSIFIARTYAHLLGGVLVFVAIESWLFASGLAERIARPMLSVSWLLVLGAFMLVAWAATRAVHRARSRAAQYAALGTFIVAESIFFVPLLVVSDRAAPGVIGSAGATAILGFAALTAVAFVTRRNFSFLRGFLVWGGLVAFGLIVAAILFGFRLGPLFSVAMIGYAGAAILYDTSKVIHHTREDRYVAAALELFSSVALLLWYLVRLFTRFGKS